MSSIDDRTLFILSERRVEHSLWDDRIESECDDKRALAIPDDYRLLEVGRS